MKAWIAGAVCALALAGASSAQQTPPATPAQPVTLIQAGRLLDQPGRAPRGPSTLVVRGTTIEAVRDGFVGPEAFPGAHVVDLRDRFVLPGLIDSHVHLAGGRAGQAGLIAGVTENLPNHAYEAANNARLTLMAGFTTVRNLGDDGGVTLALREETARHRLPGPRIVDAATSISTTGGHMDERNGLRDDLREHAAHNNVCDGVESCRRSVREQISRGADVIKIATTGGVNSRVNAGLGAQMFEDEARALIETAHLYNRRVAVHAHGDDGVALAVRLGADSIEHGTLISEATARLMARNRTFYVPTLSTVNGYIERLERDPNAYSGEVLEKIRWRIRVTGEALRRAVPLGVRIAFGTDAGVSMHGRNADEFELMVRHGMTPTTAIQAATVNAAELLGLSEQIGQLTPGRRADVIAVSGDPLSDVTVLRNVRFVMRDGRVYRDDR